MRQLKLLTFALVIGSCTSETDPVPPGPREPAICRAPSHCPGEDTECTLRTCDDGFCGVERRTGPLVKQTDGDCLTRECLNGEVVFILEYDPLDDDNACTSDECIDGEPINRPLSEAYACGESAVTHCDGNGRCVGCMSDEHCPPDTACADWSCVDEACELTPSESGLACGAPRSCAEGTVTLADTCDGVGACQGGGAEGCNGYACAEDGTSCRTTCLEDEECCCGYTCLVPALQGYGECVPP